MLETETECLLTKRWVDHQDLSAAHKLVTSHLPLAAKIAMSYLQMEAFGRSTRKGVIPAR